MCRYLLAHDLGTSGNKASLFGVEGHLVKSCTAVYPVYYDQPLYAEQEADDWWRAVCESTKKLIHETHISASDIAAVSFSGQMMGCLPVDRTGKPLRRAIIWADQRAREESDEIRKHIDDEQFYKIVGHRNAPSYGIQKAMWIKKQEPEIYEKTYKFLNAKDYIVYKLTGKFFTDYSDANSMTCFDLKGLCWSEEIVKVSGINPDKLPEITASTTYVGNVTKEAAKETGLAESVKVIMGAGDGVVANVGAGSVKPGSAYCCLGTSAWVAATSESPVLDKKRRIVCWAHAVPGLYSPNATMQYAGGSYAWTNKVLCKEERILAEQGNRSSYELMNEEIESCAKGAGGLIFLPYLMGERAPRWNPDAKGVFFGLTANTGKEQILRSVLEGIVMNLGSCLDILMEETPVENMLLIGGAARNSCWQRTVADIFQKKIRIPVCLEEAGSMGAAVIAGVGSGIYDSFDAIERFIEIKDTIMPASGSAEIYEPLKQKFEALYQALGPLF